MIAIIDYGVDEIKDLTSALDKLGLKYIYTNNEKEICSADKIILPGKGDVKKAIKQIHILNLFSALRVIKKPILGISLGMHLLCDYSADGEISCLGCFPFSAKKLELLKHDENLKGNNKIRIVKKSILFKGFEADGDAEFFFNHSYFLPENEYTTSVTLGDVKYAASIERDNFFGVQFFPEDSGEYGFLLLKNFAEM